MGNCAKAKSTHEIHNRLDRITFRVMFRGHTMTTRDRMRLALATGYGLNTVIRWDKGVKTSAATDKALMRAASELGLIKENEIALEDSHGQ